MDIKIKSITSLAETRYLKLYDAEYINKLGNLKHWTIASRKSIKDLNAQIFDGQKEKIDAVVIAAIHKTYRKLILIRQYRVPINSYAYELPAGLIDEGEDTYAAVKRELYEETGLKLISIDTTKNLQPIYVSGGMTDESIAMVYCLCDGEPSTNYLEEDEDLEVMLVSQEEAGELLKKDIKFDIKAYLILQSFSELGERIMHIK